MASGWLTGMKGGAFCIAVDGSRFGNPAEETVAYAWWLLDSEVAGWLPVQAEFARSGAIVVFIFPAGALPR